MLDKVRRILNNTITTAILGDIFRAYLDIDQRPAAVTVWSAFRSRVFR
jgi:hypothetical protein